ncbi:MAG: hypothetical protein D3917_05630 [Candidatus Electrothrix sp. AX5]|nr:hypothetical protein [Candidatus Electrothrix sp. AX5]
MNVSQALKKLKKEEQAKQFWRPKWSRSKKPKLKTEQLRKTWITTVEQ